MRAAAPNHYLTPVRACHALTLSPEQVAINRKLNLFAKLAHGVQTSFFAY